MSSTTPTPIAITVFHPLAARNILFGPILGQLRSAGYPVVLFVHKAKEAHFREVVGERAEVIGVNMQEVTTTGANLWLHRLSLLLVPSHYLWYKRVERRVGVRGWIKYLFEETFVRLFARSTFAHRAYRALYMRKAESGEQERLIKALKPRLLVLTDVFDVSDRLFAAAGRRLGTPLLGMIRSWDNCYSKGLLPVLPEEMLANTPFLKEEIHELHDMPLEHVEVIGLPQMDAFFTGEKPDRAAFMRSIGADPADKLILFAPAGAVLSDIDWQTCEILKRAMDEGAIAHKVHVLVRNHPQHPADLSRFSGDKRFNIERPGQRFGGNDKDVEFTPADQRHLIESLAATDVLLWVATTLAVDASTLDRPQIMVNFDGYESRPYLKSVRKFHDEDHMKKLVETGGSHVARTPADLIEWINRYLADPALDKEKRARIVETQVIFTDGKASERFGQAVLKAARGD